MNPIRKIRGRVWQGLSDISCSIMGSCLTPLFLWSTRIAIFRNSWMMLPNLHRISLYLTHSILLTILANLRSTLGRSVLSLHQLTSVWHTVWVVSAHPAYPSSLSMKKSCPRFFRYTPGFQWIKELKQKRTWKVLMKATNKKSENNYLQILHSSESF